MAVQAFPNDIGHRFASSFARTGRPVIRRSEPRGAGIRGLQSPHAESRGVGVQPSSLVDAALRDVMVRTFGSWWD